jgi:hypothetical protein
MDGFQSSKVAVEHHPACILIEQPPVASHLRFSPLESAEPVGTISPEKRAEKKQVVQTESK